MNFMILSSIKKIFNLRIIITKNTIIMKVTIKTKIKKIDCLKFQKERMIIIKLNNKK